MKIVSLLQVKLPLVCDIMCTMDIFLLALPMFIMVGLSIHMFTRAPSPHFNPFPVDDDYIGHNGLKSFLKDHSKAESFYSHLFNKRGGWNKRGGGAKVAKSLNVELGINEEGGIFGKN